MARPRVVMVPGFTQTGASWAGVADVVREACDVAAIDIPLRDTFEDTARAIGEAAGTAVYVGYSMGGRLCLRLALDRPDLVDALVLVSATAGIADAPTRAERAAADEELARSIDQIGVDAFIERWLAQPMFTTVPRDAPGLADRRRLSAPFLQGCLRILGAAAMEPLWHRLGELHMPVALVTGRDDAKFEDLAFRMLERCGPNVVHIRLDGGHALPLEVPAVLGGFVCAFATQHGVTD